MYPLLYPPTDVAASSWSLRGSLYYAGTEVAWTADLDGDPPFEVVLPEGAFFDVWQRDWLSSVRIRLVGHGSDGSDTVVGAAVVHVVWPEDEALWLEQETATVEAPSGAWSLAEPARLAAAGTDSVLRNSSTTPRRSSRFGARVSTSRDRSTT
ncbi:MAG: hypothetical protein ABMA64_18280 [Myxococcota bacterium]